MSDSEYEREQALKRLADAEKSTGRQDLISPTPSTEPSDPTPVDMERGRHLWLGFTLLGIIFLVIIAYFVFVR